MTTCPDTYLLSPDDHRHHLDSCPACRLLQELAMLERPDPDACARWEGLLALNEDLYPEDAAGLQQHLESCPACLVTRMAVLEEAEPAPGRPRTWKGPRMDHVESSFHFQSRHALIGAALFCAAVLLVLVGIRGAKQDDGLTTSAPPSLAATGLDAPDEAKRDEMAVTKELLVPPQPAPAATRPAKEPGHATATVDSREERRAAIGKGSDETGAQEDGDATDVESLLDAARVAMRDAEYAKGLDLCRKALAIEPDNTQAHSMAGIASCKLKDGKGARKHIAALGESRASMIRQICLREGLDIDSE